MKNIVNHVLKIGDKTAKYPIIQGGMGVGVSRSSLAGAVAACGGIGVISTAQIGYDEVEFEKNPFRANLLAIKKHIERAKQIACGDNGKTEGLIGVNVMVALKNYKEHVRAAVDAGADVIICGAGLPLDLPELVEGSKTAIAPIVSSMRACRLILKQWAAKYHRTADFLVYEGPAAGGHLGFHEEKLREYGYFQTERTLEENEKKKVEIKKEIEGILAVKNEYEKKYQKKIPLVVAGDIFSHEDVETAIQMGADGVQVGSRFVATYECDASPAYKQAYIDAKEGDICIIKSPVGLPGRAIRNQFVRETGEKRKIKKCYQCLAKCNPEEVCYCITKALIDAVRGDVEGGLVFCGGNTAKIKKIQHVSDVINELVFGEEGAE